MSAELEARVDEVERRLDAVDAVKAERDHWIGEAKRFEALYRSVDERSKRWFKDREEAQSLARERLEVIDRLAAAVAAQSARGTGTDTREALRELLEHAQASLRSQPDRLQPDVREAAKSIEVALNTLPRLAASPSGDRAA